MGSCCSSKIQAPPPKGLPPEAPSPEAAVAPKEPEPAVVQAGKPEEASGSEKVNEFLVRRGGCFAKAIENGTMAIIKGKYFKECLQKRKKLAHRALLEESEPDMIYNGNEAALLWFEYGCKFLIVVSYCWLSKGHPDPELFHMEYFAGIVEVVEKYYHIEVGVILDYCSFYQETQERARTDAETRSFKECMALINVPYGHRDVTAFKQKNVPVGILRIYDDRGWTKFESDIIDSKGKPKEENRQRNVLTPAAGPWKPQQLRDLAGCQRRPPVVPERFEREMQERAERAKEKGVDLFTNGKDQPMLVSKYKQAFADMVAATDALEYQASLGDDGVAQILEAAPYLVNLDKLDIGCCGITDKQCEVVAKALAKSQLTVLHLHDNKIGYQGAAALAQALPNSQLTVLELARNEIGDQGIASVAKALPNSQLTVLNLGSNEIGDQGTASVAKALPDSKITDLNLSFTEIGDQGAVCLAKALPDSKITNLDLNTNKIGDQGAVCLAKALAKSKITELWLNSNTIGDHGVASIAEALPEAKHLKKLNLRRNKFGQRGDEILAKAKNERPDIELLY